MKKSISFLLVLSFCMMFCFGKEVVVYFASWNLGSETADHYGEVAGIPWRYATYVNHAFWEIQPADGTKLTSEQQRSSGLGPRKAWKVVSTNPAQDFEDEGISRYENSLKRNHFSEYEYFSARYPDVNIMLSIGGWTRSGYFSEMAYTEEGRASCIANIVNILQTYMWLDGIDIDWEYPGGTIDGERPADGENQGCPIYGTVKEDKENFALFLKELREALDAEFGEGEKKLTACAGASVSRILPCQDWKAAEPYLNFINLMSYDMATPANGRTGHQSALSEIRATVRYLNKYGVPNNKICIGAPLYGIVFKMNSIPKSNFVGTPCELVSPVKEYLSQDMILGFEDQLISKSKTGWHRVYDNALGGTYLYNDSGSKYSKWFISYESEESLNKKIDYVVKDDLAGIVVWESSYDNKDHKFIRLISNTFLKGN